MKSKLLCFSIALFAVITLTNCDGTIETYSEPINFELKADCDQTGLAQIDKLYKNKNLPIGLKVMISVTVDLGATDSTRVRVLDDKVKEILKKSQTSITYTEFNALNTGATSTTYTAYHYDGNRKIDSITADFSK